MKLAQLLPYPGTMPTMRGGGGSGLDAQCAPALELHVVPGEGHGEGRDTDGASRCPSNTRHAPCSAPRDAHGMPHEVWAGVTPAARLRSACYDSMALLTMAHQPPASSNLSTRPRSCPMRSTWVRVRVRVRVKVRVRVSYPNPNPNPNPCGKVVLSMERGP